MKYLQQAAVLVAITLIAGTVYNMAYRNLEFFPKNPDGRYPNARNCQRLPDATQGGAEGTTSPGGTPAAIGSSEPVRPSDPPDFPDTDIPLAKGGPTEPDQDVPTPAESISEPEEPALSESAPAAADGIPHILHDEAFEHWQAGFLFVDARRSKDYEAGHIPGAVSIPAWEPGMDAKISELLEREVQEAPVVVYCTRSKDCEDSHIVGSNLKGAGFADIQVYQGGFPDWKDHGQPVVTGSEPGRRPQ